MALCDNSRTLQPPPQPALTVNSGDTVTVEMLTHHAGDYYAGMIAGACSPPLRACLLCSHLPTATGDPGVSSVYNWFNSNINSGTSTTPGYSPASFMRGATGKGDGVHILTGPIAVAGAVPGDVIKVEILGLRPRVNPSTGMTYGVNAAAWWGYSYGVNGPRANSTSAKFGSANFGNSAQTMNYSTGAAGTGIWSYGGSGYQREMTTVYQIVTDPVSGTPLYGAALHLVARQCAALTPGHAAACAAQPRLPSSSSMASTGVSPTRAWRPPPPAPPSPAPPTSTTRA